MQCIANLLLILLLLPETPTYDVEVVIPHFLHCTDIIEELTDAPTVVVVTVCSSAVIERQLWYLVITGPAVQLL